MASRADRKVNFRPSYLEEGRKIRIILEGSIDDECVIVTSSTTDFREIHRILLGAAQQTFKIATDDSKPT